MTALMVPWSLWLVCPQILLLIFGPFYYYQDKFVDDVSVLIGQRDDMCLLCSQN